MKHIIGKLALVLVLALAPLTVGCDNDNTMTLEQAELSVDLGATGATYALLSMGKADETLCANVANIVTKAQDVSTETLAGAPMTVAVYPKLLPFIQNVYPDNAQATQVLSTAVYSVLSISDVAISGYPEFTADRDQYLRLVSAALRGVDQGITVYLGSRLERNTVTPDNLGFFVIETK